MLTIIANKNSGGKKERKTVYFLFLLPSANNALCHVVVLCTEGKNDYREKHEIF